MSQPDTSKPASRRVVAVPSPMAPRPTTPTRGTLPIVLFTRPPPLVHATVRWSDGSKRELLRDIRLCIDSAIMLALSSTLLLFYMMTLQAASTAQGGATNV